MEFGVTRALELFEDDLVHAGASIDQGGGDDGEGAAVFDVTSGAEEAFGFVESVGIDATGEDFAACGNDGIVGAGESGDGVEENDDVVAVFDESFGFFDDHFCDLDVSRSLFVEGGRDDLALDASHHVGDLFRAFVDEEDDECDLGVIFADGVCDVLEEVRLAGSGWGDDERALSFSDRREHVKYACGVIFGIVFETEAFLRIERGEVIEKDLVAGFFGIFEVDFVDLKEGEEFFVFVRGTDASIDGVARTEVESFYLSRGDVDVIWAWEVVIIDGAQESVAVRQNLENAFAPDVAADSRLCLQEFVDKFLSAEIGGIFNVQFECLGKEFRNVHSLYFFDVHGVSLEQKESRTEEKDGIQYPIRHLTVKTCMALL